MRLVCSSLLCSVFVVAASGAVAEAPSEKFLVSRPQALAWDDDPNLRGIEGNFFVVKQGPGDYLGYVVSTKGGPSTQVLKGPSIEKLEWRPLSVAFGEKPVKGNTYCSAVDETNWQAHYKDCGMWLRYVDRSKDGYIGFFHAETNCCYLYRQTFASTGLARSTNGVHFTDALGEPLLPQSVVPKSRRIVGAAQISAVRKDPYYYLYFAYHGAQSPALARIPVDNMTSDAVEKYSDGQFVPVNEDRGDYSSIPGKHGVSPAYRDATDEFYLIGPRENGVFISHGSEPSRLTAVDAPIIASMGRNGRRTKPLLAHRPFVAHAGEGDENEAIGFAFSQGVRFPAGPRKLTTGRLLDCKLPGVGRRIRMNDCVQGEVTARRLPFLVEPDEITLKEAERYGLKPAYYCAGGRDGGERLANDKSDCAEGEAELLGYMAGERAPEYIGNVSMVGPEGGNHFSDWFYVFYNYTRPGNTRALRDLVFQKVHIAPRAPDESRAQAMLSLYEANGKHWATTTLPDRAYRLHEDFGYVSTSEVAGGVKLLDCESNSGASAAHVLRKEECAEGEQIYKLVGWSYESPRSFTLEHPLMACEKGDSGMFSYRLSIACPAGVEGVNLGYIIKKVEL